MKPICSNGYLRLPIRIYNIYNTTYVRTHIRGGRAPAADAIKRLYTQYYNIFLISMYNNARTRVLYIHIYYNLYI